MPHLDLAFRLNGSVIPVDHGYALYAGLSRVLRKSTRLPTSAFNPSAVFTAATETSSCPTRPV